MGDDARASANDPPPNRTSPSPSTANVDRTYRAIAHHRRRRAVSCLFEYGEPMTLADLADEVAVRENATDITDIPAEQVKRVYTSLYHQHVPKLVDADVVEYDQELDMVALAGNADRVKPILAAIDE